MMDQAAGKYRGVLKEGTPQSRIRSSIGQPVESYVRGGSRLASYELENPAHAYDAFYIRGKVHKPGDGAGQAMVNAVTLGTGEAITIPLTFLKLLHESGERHTLVVFYDRTLGYIDHDLFDSRGKPESNSGY